MKIIVTLIAILIFAAVATTILIYSPDAPSTKEVEENEVSTVHTDTIIVSKR